MEGSVTTRTHWTSKQNLYWTREKIAHDRVRVLWSSVQQDCARLREIWILMPGNSQFHQACSAFRQDWSWWRGANVGKTSHNRSNVTQRYTFSATALSRGPRHRYTKRSYGKLKIWLGERTTVGCQLRQHVHYYHGRHFRIESIF